MELALAAVDAENGYDSFSSLSRDAHNGRKISDANTQCCLNLRNQVDSRKHPDPGQMPTGSLTTSPTAEWVVRSASASGLLRTESGHPAELEDGSCSVVSVDRSGSSFMVGAPLVALPVSASFQGGRMPSIRRG